MLFSIGGLLSVALVQGLFVVGGHGLGFEENGFIFLGNTTDSTSQKSTRSLSLWLDRNKKNQNGAHQSCKQMGGSLLSIFNYNQDEDVRQFMAPYAYLAPFWTSGLYDTALQNYVWDSVNMEVFYVNFRDGYCQTYQSFMGIVVEGVNSQYGWCAAYWQTQFPYICKG